MDQSSQARFSIRDVSELSGVAPHTLRFWEKALNPILRPYRTPGGQRRYDDEHLALIREVHRRTTVEHHSLAAIRHDLLHTPRATTGGHDLSSRLLADPSVQRALDEVARVVKHRLVSLLETQPAEPAGPVEHSTREALS